MTGTVLSISIGGKKVFVNTARDKNTAIVIGHGASGDAESGNLPDIAEWLSSKAGITVFRYNAGGPLKSRIATLKALMDSKEGSLGQVKSWILAGHSMGGRTACAVAAERSDDVAAVVLFSYPLHPPGKKDDLRDTDLTALTCPVLIVRGSKDNFSTEPTFSEVMQRMASTNLQIEMVEGGDHSLSTKTGAGKGRFEAFMGKVESFVTEVTDGMEKHSKMKGKTKQLSKSDAHPETAGISVAAKTKASQGKEKQQKRASQAPAQKPARGTASSGKRKLVDQEQSPKTKRKTK